MILEQHLKMIKARPEMYFGPDPNVNCLYNYLLGWEHASGGDRIGYKFIRHLAAKLHTGSGVPGPEDISFQDAIEELLGFVLGD